jgi:hypothetical protein
MDWEDHVKNCKMVARYPACYKYWSRDHNEIDDDSQYNIARREHNQNGVFNMYTVGNKIRMLRKNFPNRNHMDEWEIRARNPQSDLSVEDVKKLLNC